MIWCFYCFVLFFLNSGFTELGKINHLLLMKITDSSLFELILCTFVDGRFYVYDYTLKDHKSSAGPTSLSYLQVCLVLFLMVNSEIRQNKVNLSSGSSISTATQNNIYIFCTLRPSNHSYPEHYMKHLRKVTSGTSGFCFQPLRYTTWTKVVGHLHVIASHGNSCH